MSTPKIFFRRQARFIVRLLILFGLLSACHSQPAPQLTASPLPSASASPFEETQTPTVTSTSTQPPSPIPSPMPAVHVWIAPFLPEAFRSELQLPEAWQTTDQSEQAEIQVTVGDQNPISRWIYALVAPFPTIPDGVSSQELQDSWNGIQSGSFGGLPILMDQDTLQVLTAWWGPPAQGAAQVEPAEQLLDQAWQQRPSWAIIPFERLEPRWKVLAVDGLSPILKSFEPEGYPLAISFSAIGAEGQGNEISLAGLKTTASNRDPNRLTTVVLTGVTAMVRGTAVTMESRGALYPGEDIAPWLKEADITHISNEIAFTPDCPPPRIDMPELIFCSDPRYIDLLKSLGTDVVELTGDHLGDYQSSALFYTLQMYKDLGWKYYGGGANAEEARQPALFEHNGNRIAFIGCNGKRPVDVSFIEIATDTQPGAARCDYDYLKTEIAQLTAQGYLVIATFQHTEYYTYRPEPDLVKDFRAVAEDGAVIVSGSQAHQPHGMEFYQNAFIHYGLGNLFFDQFNYFPEPKTNRAFIDRYVIYDGRYIATELLTIEFIDLARSRPTTPAERADFLQLIFSASGW